MKKVKQALIDKIMRIIFWLPESQIQMIKKETKEKKYKNQSELMKHIVNSWFKK